MRAVVDALAQDRLSLPSPPEVAIRVGELCHRDDVSAVDLAEEVSKDPAITVRLIRAANSAMVRGRHEVDSVQQAIMRLGFSFTRSLVYSVAMEQMFAARRHPLLAQRLHRAWSESVEVAALAQVLAAQYTLVAPPAAMLAGLIHQIGVLPIIRLSEDDEEWSTSPELLESVIRALHPRVGRLVLQAWGFSADLVDVPEGYLQPGRAHDGPADLLDVIVVAVLTSQARSQGALAMIDRNNVPAFAKLDVDPEGDPMEDEELRRAYESVYAALTGH